MINAIGYNDPYTYFMLCYNIHILIYCEKSRSILFKSLFYSAHCSKINSIVWLWTGYVLQVCQALLLSLSAVSLSLVCEEDGTEVESDQFLMTLPDNTALMALEPGQTWRARPVCLTKQVFDYIPYVSNSLMVFNNITTSQVIHTSDSCLQSPRVQLCTNLKTNRGLGET